MKLPKRKVPVAMMKLQMEERKDLQSSKISIPVEESTDWISCLVTIQKSNGKLTMCIDLIPLNKTLMYSHFPHPTINDILPDPFGRFRWLRMAMGISAVPDIFQRKLTQSLEGLLGI